MWDVGGTRHTTQCVCVSMSVGEVVVIIIAVVGSWQEVEVHEFLLVSFFAYMSTV